MYEQVQLLLWSDRTVHKSTDCRDQYLSVSQITTRCNSVPGISELTFNSVHYIHTIRRSQGMSGHTRKWPEHSSIPFDFFEVVRGVWRGCMCVYTRARHCAPRSLYCTLCRFAPPYGKCVAPPDAQSAVGTPFE